MTTVFGGVSPILLPPPMKLRGSAGQLIGGGRLHRAITPGEAAYVNDVQRQLAVLQKNMQDVLQQIKDATPGAVVYGLQPIFDLSQELVPVDTGDLKLSGFLEGENTSTGAAAVVGYGKGGHPTYAALVHERTDFRHAKGKQAKFLEEAVNQKFSTFERRVKLYMSKLFDGEVTG